MLHTTIRPACRFPAWVLAAAFLCGCANTPKVSPGDEAVGMLMPRRLEIQPFTKIKSFDDDRVPDGIELVIRFTDQFGDPVKAVGHMYFELYAFQNASGERKGDRLEFWDRTIANAKDVRLYWNRTAQMYEFPLAWTQGLPSTTGRKLILTATYRAPWGETLEDEYVLELPSRKPQAGAATTQPG